SQICTEPLVLSASWNRMSALPSLLKSPAPMACQDKPGLPTVVMLTTDVPFISQTAVAPLVFWNSRSVLPSLLKSSAATTCQAEPGFASETVLVLVVPFISQICGVPSLVCTTMSALPSLLKLPAASTTVPFGVVIVPEAVIVVPLSNSTITSGWLVEAFCSKKSDLLSPSKSFLASVETLAAEWAVAVAVPGA